MLAALLVIVGHFGEAPSCTSSPCLLALKAIFIPRYLERLANGWGGARVAALCQHHQLAGDRRTTVLLAYAVMRPLVLASQLPTRRPAAGDGADLSGFSSLSHARRRLRRSSAFWCWRTVSR